MDWKKICRGLGWSIAVLGVIGSIGLAWMNGEVENYYYNERNWLLTLLWFVAGLFSTALPAVIFFVMGEILERLELMNSDVYTVKRTVAEMKRDSDDLRKVEIGEAWKCSGCGKVNMKYTGICGCGRHKNEN